MKVCKVSEISDLDAKAIKDYGISEQILMENAGEAVYFVILKEYGVKNKNFVVFCGPGNNGGDGFVVARKLHSNAANVKVLIFGDSEKYSETAKNNLERVKNANIVIKKLECGEDAKKYINTANAIIDGIFGVGLFRNVDGIYKDVIQLINESGKPVFAIDIPSGINGDTGQEMGISVKANYTVTFGLPKIGNLFYPGYGRCGKLYVSHISYPIALQTLNSLKIEVFKPIPLPTRLPTATKFSYGPVLFISGSKNYFWAPVASAYSFLKAGGGYAYLACPESIAPFLAEKCREIVFIPQKHETEDGSLALKSKDSILNICKEKKPKMVVIGPGVSTNEETQQLVRELVIEIDKPLLIDGDGITAVSKDLGIINARKEKTILTPHIGEMARLTKIDSKEIENNKVEILQKTSNDLNSIIVLKMPHTLIGYPDRSVYITLTGDSSGMAGMATAGSGDVLNGTIAAMHALGLNLELAVPTGVFIHGLAGDLSAKEKGPDGMVASDILNYLPYAVKYYRENFDTISENFYNKIYVV